MTTATSLTRSSARVIRTIGDWIAPSGEGKGRLCIVNYHRVLDTPNPLLESEPDVATFRWQMEVLASCFNVLPLHDAVQMLGTRRMPPRAVCITFDDGYRSVYDLALPILQQFDLPATVFVTSGCVGGGNMWNDRIIDTVQHLPAGQLDLRELGLGAYSLGSLADRKQTIRKLTDASKYLPPQARLDLIKRLELLAGDQLEREQMLTPEMVVSLDRAGVEIGAHTITHPILTSLDDDSARLEIEGSKSELEAIIGKPVRLFAYPNGKVGKDFDERHTQMARAAGFSAAFTTNVGAATSAQDRFQLPRSLPWDKSAFMFGVRLLRWLAWNARHPSHENNRDSSAFHAATPDTLRAPTELGRHKNMAATGTVRLSVIIPCYNAETYICATIESVLAQDESDIEIIVVDDGSRDRSVELVRATFPGVNVVQQANQGVAAARNNGLRLAQGEWIAFVDADDIWLPGKLAAQFALLAASPSCRMSYCAWQEWHSSIVRPDAAYLADIERGAQDRLRWQGPSGWIYPQLLYGCKVWTSTVLAHRSLFDEIGVFDTSLRIGEDYDLWLRASRVTQILRVGRPYALYRRHPDSITKSRQTKNYRAIVVERALAQWGMQSPDGRLADTSEVARRLAESWSDFAYNQLQFGDIGQAKSASWRSLRLRSSNLAGWKMLVKSYASMLVGTSSKGRA